jgi:hypothetical protein
MDPPSSYARVMSSRWEVEVLVPEAVREAHPGSTGVPLIPALVPCCWTTPTRRLDW